MPLFLCLQFPDRLLPPSAWQTRRPVSRLRSDVAVSSMFGWAVGPDQGQGQSWMCGPTLVLPRCVFPIAKGGLWGTPLLAFNTFPFPSLVLVSKGEPRRSWHGNNGPWRVRCGAHRAYHSAPCVLVCGHVAAVPCRLGTRVGRCLCNLQRVLQAPKGKTTGNHFWSVLGGTLGAVPGDWKTTSAPLRP